MCTVCRTRVRRRRPTPRANGNGDRPNATHRPSGLRCHRHRLASSSAAPGRGDARGGSGGQDLLPSTRSALQGNKSGIARRQEGREGALSCEEESKRRRRPLEMLTSRQRRLD